MTQRIGIYSGTFDPIHAGHIAFGNAVFHTHGLGKVIFIPEADPRSKPSVTAIKHRIAMIRQAIEPHDGLDVLSLQSSRFTIADTLPELRQLFPDAELSLLIGSDIARTLGQWEDLELLKDIRLIVGMRENDRPEDIRTIAEQLHARYQIPFSMVPAEQTTSHANSSTIRRGDTSHLPNEILPYVILNNLYQ